MVVDGKSASFIPSRRSSSQSFCVEGDSCVGHGGFEVYFVLSLSTGLLEFVDHLIEAVSEVARLSSPIRVARLDLVASANGAHGREEVDDGFGQPTVELDCQKDG